MGPLSGLSCIECYRFFGNWIGVGCACSRGALESMWFR